MAILTSADAFGNDSYRNEERPLRLVNRRTKVAARLLIAFIAAIAMEGFAAAQTPTEYQIKAVFLYNFAKFVEWPAQQDWDANSPIIIGILGDDPFGPEIQRTINGKTANGRPLVTKRFPNLRALEYCHILFISSSEQKNLRATLAAVGPGILTVGDTEWFVQTGGMINFLLIENKVQFEINKQAAERAGLRISAKLLNLSHTARH